MAHPGSNVRACCGTCCRRRGRGTLLAGSTGERLLPPPRAVQPVSPQPYVMSVTRRAARRSTRPIGFTLVEVIVVLGVLAMGAALTIPAITRAPEEPASLGQLVRDARRTAIARAQPLELRVDASGSWTLTSVREGQPLVNGTLDESVPIRSASIVFSASGACVLRTALPPEWASWDAARCTPVQRQP